MSITGHEDEFRALFAEEAEERLDVLTAQLMQLEQTPDDAELIASLFREAHTLKGASAVVGIDEVRIVAHAMEDLLHQLRSGDRAATAALIDQLLMATDHMRDAIPVILQGGSHMGAAAAVEQQLRALAGAPPRTVDESVGEVDPMSPMAEPAAGPPAASPDPDAGPVSGPGPGGGDAPVPRTDPTRVPEPVPVGAGASADAGSGGAEEAAAVEAPAAGPAARRTEADAIRVPLARLDQIVRLVGESAAAHLRVGRLIGDSLGVDPGALDEVRDLSRVLNELQELTMRARMVPVVTITDVLQRAVRDVARTTGKSVRWEVRGEDTELDRGVLQQLADPLLHMVRNAVDHGLESTEERIAAGKDETGVVRFHAMQIGSEVILTITDDGRGIDVDRVRTAAARHMPEVADLPDDEALYLVFRSGLSTASFVTDISGRGVGLDVVRANVEAVRGRIEIRTEVGAGTEFRVIVPITLAVLPCLLVRAGGMRLAIPMHSVVVAQSEGLEQTAEGKPVVWHGAQALPLAGLAATLGLPADHAGPVLIVTGLTRRYAFRVAELIGQRDVVVKGMSRLLPRLDVLAGASVEPDGSILLVLDVPGLIDRARFERGRTSAASSASAELVGARPASVRARVLVVDDAMTVRELQRSILERAGYQVATAVDGVDALARLSEASVDLVLTDVEMPRMDGFALTEAIRAHPSLGNVPVLILTSRASEEDRQRGLLAGADGYIIKSAFDEAGLLSAVERLLGR